MAAQPLDRTFLASVPARVEAALARLESARQLDAWANRIEPAVRRLTGTGARRDALTGRWLGHPVHPAGVTVPIGCWTASSFLDLLGGRGSRGAARRLVAVGVVTAAPVAVSGAADWLDIRGAERRVASVHALTNAAAVGLYGASWLLRRRGRHAAGVATGLAGAAVASAAGFLGGHVAYRRGVGVSTTAFEAGPTEWTVVGASAPPPGGYPVVADVGGVPLMVATDLAGGIHVLDDRCTHRGGPLHEGTVHDGCIVCPWHASRFDLVSGAVRAGPASAPQAVYETESVDGHLRIRRSEEGDLRRNPVR